MTKIKFNELEAKLLKRAVDWYLMKVSKDKELIEILKKDDWSIEDMEKVKDMMRLYHQKTGLGNKLWHNIEIGIFEKFGEKVVATDTKLKIKRKKEDEKKRKKAEADTKKAEAEKAKAEAKVEKEAEKKKADIKKKQEELQKDKFSAGDIFTDLDKIE